MFISRWNVSCKVLPRERNNSPNTHAHIMVGNLDRSKKGMHTQPQTSSELDKSIVLG